jgi:hypothetical protein
MKPVHGSLTASVFSIAKGRSSIARDILPSDALVIVIEERAGARTALFEIEWNHLGEANRVGFEALPTLQRKAERAYSDFPVAVLSPTILDLAA